MRGSEEDSEDWMRGGFTINPNASTHPIFPTSGPLRLHTHYRTTVTRRVCWKSAARIRTK